MTSVPKSLPKSLVDTPALDRWLAFDRPGRLTAFTGKVELGQGILTALAQIVAEELDLAPARIDLVSGDTGRSPDEGLTAGSQSIEVGGGALRLAAAEARARLLAAASLRLNTAAATLTVEDGAVLADGRPTGQDYWSLAGGVDWTRPVSGETPPKPAGAYRIVGTSLPRDDLAQKLGGGAYIHDVALPGLRHARVLRQPFRCATLAGFDEARLAARHPEVAVVRRGDFLALVADDEHAVLAALPLAERLAEWRDDPGSWQPPVAADERVIETGTPPATPAGRAFEASYSRPLLAHASIGLSCALAQYDGGRLTVWTHSQGVFLLRAQLARVLGLPVEAITLRHAAGAGCYGHNGADDAALDAALVATVLPGRPVRVLWTRADELSRGPLGPWMRGRVAATLDEAGRIADWRYDVESAPHAQRPGSGGQVNLASAEAIDRRFRPTHVEDLPEAIGGGASRNAVALYDLPHQRVAVRLATASRIRTSSLRGLGAHLNVFAIESAMDELADLAGTDPLAFRLAHLADDRARAVLAEAAAMAGWRADAPRGEGRAQGIGLARYKGKGAWLAAVAEVAVDEAVRVERLWLAVDAGLLINPDGARNQVEGGAVQAVSWTIKEAVPAADDRVPALDWDAYPILRFSEVPEIETRSVAPVGAPPIGAGEPAQGPVAAAVGNAVARALGVRVRDLPITRERILAAMEP